MYIVKIQSEKACYLCDGVGDPPRTMLKCNAKRYNSIGAAERAIIRASKTHPFSQRVYEIIKDE